MILGTVHVHGTERRQHSDEFLNIELGSHNTRFVAGGSRPHPLKVSFAVGLGRTSHFGPHSNAPMPSKKRIERQKVLYYAIHLRKPTKCDSSESCINPSATPLKCLSSAALECQRV